jgi:isochorismate synthase
MALISSLETEGSWDGTELPPALLGPWFGGLAFDLGRPAKAQWPGFPPARFLLPKYLVWRQGATHGLVAFSMDGREDAQRRLEVGRGQLRVVPAPRAGPVELRVKSDRPAWDALVARALERISRGDVRKVVAARVLEAELGADLDPLACAERLRRRAGRCATFLIRGQGGAAFLGATPERLCRLVGTQLETEALASSARPAESAGLAHVDKEQREHSEVVEGIREALAPLSRSLDVGAEPRLLELPYISHLRTPVRATLHPEIGLDRVLTAMYPTAAVGGAPRDAALRFLSAEEGWDRGWYAGAIGFLGPRGADLHVAIRSAWVQGQRARVFAGAGLVQGSTAEKEWQETEDKARPMLADLAEAHALP